MAQSLANLLVHVVFSTAELNSAFDFSVVGFRLLEFRFVHSALCLKRKFS